MTTANQPTARVAGALAFLWGQLAQMALNAAARRYLYEELDVILLDYSGASSDAIVRQALADASRLLKSHDDSDTPLDTYTASHLVARPLAKAVDLLTRPPPPSLDPSRPSLPPEILSLIFEELVASTDTFELPDNKTYRNPQAETFAQLALVSRTFLPFARHHLYQILRMHVVDQLVDSEGDIRDLETSARRQSEVEVGYAHRLVRTLNRSPHLAAIVRRIELKFNLETSRMDKAVFRVLETILQATEFVEQVSFDDGDGADLASFCDVLWSSRRRFKLIKVNAVCFDGTDFSNLFDVLEDQEELAEFVFIGDMSTEVDPSWSMGPKALRSLKLETGEDNFHHPSFFIWLSLPSAATLTHLYLHVWLSEDTPLCNLAHLDALHTLTIRFSTDCYSADERRMPEEVVQDRRRQATSFFSLLPSTVTSLAMVISPPDGSTYSDLDFIHVPASIDLGALPSTLQNLDIAEISNTPADISSYLASPKACSLRRMRYSVEGEGWDTEAHARVEAEVRRKGIRGNW